MANEENDKQKQETEDILQEVENEINEIENEEGQIDEEKLEDVLEGEENRDELNSSNVGLVSEAEPKEANFKDKFLKLQADFDNYKKRVARDKEDMIFFLKKDILEKILPRIDDLERIINNTPSELMGNTLFEGVISVHKKLLEDLKKLGVEPFASIGQEVNPDKHNVMTIIPGKPENIIVDEFEKGYVIGDRVLRHAKVVVGAGES